MISVNSVSKFQGGAPLYENVSFQINPGEKVGLVGPNGAGKTTFFRIIVGEEKIDKGSVSFSDGIRLAYFSQNVGEMKGRTALEEVMSGSARVVELEREIKTIEKRLEDSIENPLSDDDMANLLEKLGDFQTEFEKLGGYEMETNAKEILTGLGIAPADHGKLTQDFSGGWKMRIALAKVLVTKPDCILMDEPTNYLDLETIIWLEEWLKNFKGAIFMTSHDREFMNGIVKKIVEVAHGAVTTYSGNFDFYMQEREIRRKQQVAAFERQQDKLAKEEEFIARFAARASHAAQVQSRVKKLDKIERVELPPEEQSMSFQFATPKRGGNDVVVITDLAKSWKNSKNEDVKVFEGLTATVSRLDKIAVVGVNGAGKSTLLKVICGQTDPSKGTAVVGPSIEFGYFSQYALDVLDPDLTVFDTVRNKLAQASDGYVRNLLAAFLFQGDDVLKKVKVLSGGEKSRLVLATILSLPYNLLVLDEPTNHLDMRSREVLLEALQQYEGTILFVSHDRHFLHALSNRVFEVDKGGIRVFEGGFDYYVEKKKSEEKR